VAVRSTINLTKRTVDAAKATGQRYYLWDSSLRGFGLRIEASGAKTFFVKYRVQGGRSALQRILKIGRYGPLTPEEARKKAMALLGQAASGKDPGGDAQAKRLEMTIAELVDFYEEHGCVVQRGRRIGTPMKPMTKQYTMARLRHHVVPLLGRRIAREINAGDIERFCADVAAGKTAKNEKIGPRRRIIVKGGEGASRKVVRDLSAVFSFAKRSEIVERNPCDTAAVRKTDNAKTRFLTLEEVRRLGSALDELQAEGVNPKALDITRLWALTGCRRNEISALRWNEVDFEKGLLVLDDSKTGKSIRPLGSAALAILGAIDHVAEAEYVFPADSGDGHFQGVKTPWAKAIKRANLAGVTPHTLRHTIGSTAISTGEALALTGAILGHSNPRSTAIYAHVQHEPSKKAANRVSKKIASALIRGVDESRLDTNMNAEDRKLLARISQRIGMSDHSAKMLRQALLKIAA